MQRRSASRHEPQIEPDLRIVRQGAAAVDDAWMHEARSAALEATGDGVLVVDAIGRLIHINAAARRVLDLDAETPRVRGVRSEPMVLPPELARHLIEQPNRQRVEFAVGALRIVEAWIAGEADAAVLRGMRAIVLRDVTARRSDERRLLHLAHHDSLTGLANRYSFIQALSNALEEAEERQRLLALLYVDLDRFKDVNDSLGHAAGDRLLCLLAHRLRSVVESRVARLAGDEFALVMPDLSDPEDAGALASQILGALSEPVSLEGVGFGCSASVGIAVFPNDGRDVDSLSRHADVALYAAKSRGRNRYEFYRASLDVETDRRRKIRDELSGAIDRGELRLEYQPRLRLQASVLGGFEALLRWTSPRLGVVSPAEFIGVAERAGLINGIGAWCLGEACRQIRRWREEGLVPLPVSVNVSEAQLADGDLYDVVTHALERWEIEPEMLELELTESRQIEDDERTALCLRDLRAIGVRIALDDFGTGYSSLTYLNRFPLDTLKLDRRFFREIEFDPAAIGIVSSVVAMGHALGLSVVAEGVDSEEQLDLLREMLCDEVQGFLFAPALPPREARRFLARVGCAPPRVGVGGKLEPERAGEAVLRARRDPVASSKSWLSGPRRVLVLDDAERTLSPLALRLLRLGIDAQCATSTEEARLMIEQEKRAIRLLAVSPRSDLAGVSEALDCLARELGGVEPVFIVVGDEPDVLIRERIRKAGARQVLWTPIDDSELRFVVNSSMAFPDELARRQGTRVPANLLAAVQVGRRRESAVVGNLSVRGAFLEMPDPPPLASVVRIEFSLVGGVLALTGRVRHRQTSSPRLPAFASPGAGVVFEAPTRASEAALVDFVESRASRYRP